MITGDYSKLEALASAFGDTKRHREEIARALGKWISNHLEEEFDDKVGPYGRWARRKQYYTPLTLSKGRVAVRSQDVRTNPLLVDTGWLKRSFTVFANDEGVDVVNFVPYAFYIQYGTKNMPPRKMVPEVEYDSLGNWGAPMIKIALNKLRYSLYKEGALGTESGEEY